MYKRIYKREMEITYINSRLYNHAIVLKYEELKYDIISVISHAIEMWEGSLRISIVI